MLDDDISWIDTMPPSQFKMKGLDREVVIDLVTEMNLLKHHGRHTFGTDDRRYYIYAVKQADVADAVEILESLPTMFCPGILDDGQKVYHGFTVGVDKITGEDLVGYPRSIQASTHDAITMTPYNPSVETLHVPEFSNDTKTVFYSNGDRVEFVIRTSTFEFLPHRGKELYKAAPMVIRFSHRFFVEWMLLKSVQSRLQQIRRITERATLRSVSTRILHSSDREWLAELVLRPSNQTHRK